jgi:hypothetical protein
MTHNQAHALELAEGLLSSTVSADQLTDQEWHLMLLAAGLNSYCAPPTKVALLTLQNAQSGAGYFTGVGTVTEPAGMAG